MRIKRPFISEIHNIIKKFGKIVSRRDLVNFCTENNITIPAILYSHRAGRGFFDLSEILKMAPDYKEKDVPLEPDVLEKTDYEIEKEINAKFATLEFMTYGIIQRSFHSLIVSGSPGIGKTWALEKVLQEAADSSKILFTSIRGHLKATGLYKILYDNRFKEAVILVDDSDEIFGDLTSINIMKAVLDTTRTRHVCWKSEHKFKSEEDGEEVPTDFIYEGSIIFCSNLNFPHLITQGSKISIHLEALMSRSFFMDLNLNSPKEMIIRIRSLLGNILSNVCEKDRKIIFQHIIDNQNSFQELSLRTAVKCGILWKASNKNVDLFQKLVAQTMFKK
jgi:hypothetical protein